MCGYFAALQRITGFSDWHGLTVFQLHHPCLQKELLRAVLMRSDWEVKLLWLTCAGECMEAVSSELSFFTLPNCFELFGFDLLVDEDWHLWLLEVSLLHLC